MSISTDLLIVTVTKAESKAVFQVFQKATGINAKILPINDLIFHDLGEVNEIRVTMIRSDVGELGVNYVVKKSVVALSPSAVIMVGVAFGLNRATQSVGEILISRRLIPIDVQDADGNYLARVGSNQAFRILTRSDLPYASPWLVNRFRNAEMYWDHYDAKVRFGSMISVNAVVDNNELMHQLRDIVPRAIGGEMEGAGLSSACQDSKTDGLIVKSVCDWADGKKSDSFKKTQDIQVAAYNSANYLLHTLQLAPLKKNLIEAQYVFQGGDNKV